MDLNKRLNLGLVISDVIRDKAYHRTIARVLPIEDSENIRLYQRFPLQSQLDDITINMARHLMLPALNYD